MSPPCAQGPDLTPCVCIHGSLQLSRNLHPTASDCKPPNGCPFPHLLLRSMPVTTCYRLVLTFFSGEFPKMSSTKQSGQGMSLVHAAPGRGDQGTAIPCGAGDSSWAQATLPWETYGNCFTLLKSTYVRGVVPWNLSLCFSFWHFSANDLRPSSGGWGRSVAGKNIRMFK